MAKLGKALKGKSKKKGGKGGGTGDQAAKQLVSEGEAAELADVERVRQAKEAEALKSMLDKELAMSRVNGKKVRNGWLKIMRLSKLDALRRDVEVISQNHERDVDRRDALLQMLDRDVDEAEEQYQMALRDHMRNVDNLLLLQDTRLTALESAFQAELESLEDEYTKEKTDIMTQFNSEKKELLDLVEAVESQEAYHAAEIKQEFEQSREEVRNKNIEDVNVLSATLDAHIEELERHFESAHLNYLQNTDKRTEEYKKLTRDDAASSEAIAHKVRKEDRFKASIAHWKVKIAQNGRDFAEKNKALADEKTLMASHVHKLKTKMVSYRKSQNRRLRELSVAADEAKKTIAERMELAERMLKLSEVARKHESTREKVAPYYEGATTAETAVPAMGLLPYIKQTHEDDGSTEHKVSEVVGAGEPADADAMAAKQQVESAGVLWMGHKMVTDGTADELDTFYKKYNQVLLSKLAVERERDRLAGENAQLQSILKQYLEGISVTEDVMKGPNPLLVVNGRANTLPPPVRQMAPPSAVVEGNHMVATHRVAT